MEAQLLKEYPQLSLDVIKKVILYCQKNEVEVPAEFDPEVDQVHLSPNQPIERVIEGAVEYYENPEDAPPVKGSYVTENIIVADNTNDGD